MTVDQSTGLLAQQYRLVLVALRDLPDHCAADVDDLATRVGAEKLTLIRWIRADLDFARLTAAKISRELPPVTSS
jgi:hypothetical protein